MRKTFYILIATVSLCLSSLTVSTVYGSTFRKVKPTPVVHALLILGSDSSFQVTRSLKVDRDHITNLLLQVSQHCPVHLTVIGPNLDGISRMIEMKFNPSYTFYNVELSSINVKKQQISTREYCLDWLKTLHTDSNDTVLIYYAGSGAVTASDSHILNFVSENDETVARADLTTLLKAQPARLKMLITDTDAHRVDTQTPEDVESGQVSEDAKSETDTDNHGVQTPVADEIKPDPERIAHLPYLRHLFLQHKGMLDMTAAALGQQAFGSEGSGGMFTRALMDSLDIDMDQDRFVSWREVFETTRKETETDFIKAKPYIPSKLKGTAQTPVAHALPEIYMQLFDAENIVYIQDDSHAYLAELDSMTVRDDNTYGDVWIFNEALRAKLGRSIPMELVLDKRTEPEAGWSKKHTTLSFYRDEVWTSTGNVTVFENHYLLPKDIDGKEVQGEQRIGFGDIRIPLPITNE